MSDQEHDQEHDQERPHPTAEETAAWYAAWHVAWEAVESQGGCDTVGSREFRRITAEARRAELDPHQATMRLFIIDRAQLPPIARKPYRRTL